VIANVQVVFVAVAAWWLFGERPTQARILVIAVVLGGVALTSAWRGTTPTDRIQWPAR
jgi:drug/metabolite transporter (DMT)-like permease